MAQNRSFTDYVADRFYNEMFAEIEKYLEENCDYLDLRLNRVRNIGKIELSDIEVKFVSVNDLPDMKIEFDVVLEAELEVRESDYHYDESENCRQWFVLKCSGDLDCNLDDFAISTVAEYTSKNRNSKPMSDSLVPIISKDQLESIATDFLQRNYPEALKTPMAVEPQRLAEKMGLKLKMRTIIKDCSIFGQIYFHDCDTEFYDEDIDEMVATHVDACTIFVDPNAYFLRNVGSVNNTIVHECVHWDLHRKAFELERLYNSSATRIKCQVAGGIKGNQRDATDWMEWQANALAPKIQMPLAMFKTKAFEFINKYREELGTSELIDVMEQVIRALATFFCVSLTAAKIRMIDAGFEEAIGTLTYIDGRYIKPHKFKKGALQRNQTFSIGARDAAVQSITNFEMSSLLKDGSYQYVDAHFVLNHPKYLIHRNEVAELTNYARYHMDECCIIFNLAVRSGQKEKYHSECFLNRDEYSNIDFEIKYCNGYEHSTKEKKVKLLADILKEDARIYNELPNSYTKSLEMLIAWRGVTYKELGEKINLDPKTIGRIISGETKGSINSIILICLGLNLPPSISGHIIKNCPHSIDMTDGSHQWYSFVLTYQYTKSIKEIRSFLLENGAEPL